ncbi:MAG: ATP-dependent sacrificial sulfur transferase LarE [Halanaerobacter sp.]
MDLTAKYNRLQDIIAELEKVVIAFSGGVDSALLAKVAYDVLGANAIAVTAKAPIHAEEEIRQAKKMAQEIGIGHQILEIDGALMEEIKDNPSDRCYYCKHKIFTHLQEFAGDCAVIDGTNADDVGDYRPGAQAIEELGVRSPLQEAKLNKAEVRQLSKRLDLSTWDFPSTTCLATRFPYGEEISQEKLDLVERAEDYLRQLGFEELRVRYHCEVARIEVALEEQTKFFNLDRMEEINQKLQEFGFDYVALDLGGYQTGKLNKLDY